MINYIQLAIVIYCTTNPILTTTVYTNAYAQHSFSQKLRVIFFSLLSVFIILSSGLYFGRYFLSYLGVPFYAIQLGGGLLILLVGIGQMLFNESVMEFRFFMQKFSTMFGQSSTNAKLNSSIIFDKYPNTLFFNWGIMPLALPIMINPVSVLLILFIGQQASPNIQIHLILILLVVCVIKALSLLSSSKFGLAITYLGALTINRIVGLFLTIIAFEMLIAGIKAIIPILLN